MCSRCSTSGASPPPMRRCGRGGKPSSPRSGVAAVHAELGRVDPDAAASILPTDGRRLVRALEVVEITGQPFAASAPRIGEPRWGTHIVGVDRDTAELDDRIAAPHPADVRPRTRRRGPRADRRGTARRRHRAAGPSATHRSSPSSTANTTSTRRSERTFIGTRRYVRRQRSWFRRDTAHPLGRRQRPRPRGHHDPHPRRDPNTGRTMSRHRPDATVRPRPCW